MFVCFDKVRWSLQKGFCRYRSICTFDNQCWHVGESKTENQRDLFAGWCLWALVVLDCVWHRSTWDAQCSQTLCFSFGQRFRHAHTRIHTVSLTLLFSVRTGRHTSPPSAPFGRFSVQDSHLIQTRPS